MTSDPTLPLFYLVANWKMSGSKEKVIRWQRALSIRKRHPRLKLIFSPPCLYYHLVSKIALCAQTLSAYESGARTGEIAANMLREYGVSFALINHLEHPSSDWKTIKATLSQAWANQITPILCFNDALTEQFPFNSLRAWLAALMSLAVPHKKPLLLAYEPESAVNSDDALAITPIETYLLAIRNELRNQAAPFPLLYGGSCNEKTIAALLAIKAVNGFLIGRASKDPLLFADLVLKIESSLMQTDRVL